MRSRRDITSFVEFPFHLYRHAKNWVPPLVSSVRLALNREKHPFYRHSEADFFLLERGGQVIGRIAAMENRNYNRYRHARTAFFGFFDVIANQKAAQMLLDVACQWAAERGLHTMIGPRGLIGTDGGGILVEGFEHRAAMGVTYNYPYYDGLIRRAGFVKDTDFFSGFIGEDFRLPERRTTTKANINGIGLLPEHQGRGGVALLYVELAQTLLKHRYRHVDLVQAEENKAGSVTEIERHGGRWINIHRSYRRCLTA